MSTFEANNADIERNGSIRNGSSRRHRRRRRRRRPSMAASSETTTTDGSLHFTDSDSDQSWHSPLGSMAGESEGILVNCEPQRDNKQKRGSFSDEEIDLESGELELLKLQNKEERDCRICHLSLLKSGGISSSGGDQVQEHTIGMAIELGCCCKGDLGAAHKQCAETWFKTKGNTICEICGANALNIAGEQTNEANNATIATVAAPVGLSETRVFWHGRRVMNFLLASMVFAFVISWLFHFNILP
ncbi:PREDICTED: uncharacterized protein LOC109213992 [Nicotiana attenuata]|uniref:RING-CH-type domain-containing protein n=1 Tax=Nicotiana attenuata TaxID=49451 RepID=A0A1J6IPL1_NICAT|nr:PREDICTED: uncharacterized protein LOC109213992 [Nicotiana attenuata]OIT06782.1 hypothetical protein A4A49_24278 [Nicotiana attenuata]